MAATCLLIQRKNDFIPCWIFDGNCAGIAGATEQHAEGSPRWSWAPRDLPTAAEDLLPLSGFKFHGQH